MINNNLYDEKENSFSPAPIINSSTSLQEVHYLITRYINTLNNFLDHEISKEEVKKCIGNIQFLFQTADFAKENFEYLFVIEILIKVYIKFNEYEIKHDVLDLIEFLTQNNQIILGFIIKETNFIQDNLLNFNANQTLEEKIQFIHFVLAMSLSGNEDIIRFFLVNNFIEFIFLELKEFSSLAYDHQEPKILSVLTYLIDNLFHFYYVVNLLSNTQINYILSSFLLIIQNSDDFYLFDLYVDDIMLALIKSIKHINPSYLLVSDLFNQILLNLYSIEDYKFEKKMLLIFFTEFFEKNSTNDCLQQFLEKIDFQLICQSFINLDDTDLYCYFFNLINEIIQINKIFIEILFKLSFFNFILLKASDLSYNSKISFWSLILTIIVDFPSVNSKVLLDDHNMINELFEFLKVSDRDFITSNLNHLIRSATFSSQHYKYYQSCLTSYFLYLYECEIEIFELFQDYIPIKE